eukprot:scaffold55369_cov79-Phaeocystis_antarctica.AAC.3
MATGRPPRRRSQSDPRACSRSPQARGWWWRVTNGYLWWPHLCAVLVEAVEHHDHVETLQRSPGNPQVLARQRTGGQEKGPGSGKRAYEEVVVGPSRPLRSSWACGGAEWVELELSGAGCERCRPRDGRTQAAPRCRIDDDSSWRRETRTPSRRLHSHSYCCGGSSVRRSGPGASWRESACA